MLDKASPRENTINTAFSYNSFFLQSPLEKIVEESVHVTPDKGKNSLKIRTK